VLRFTNPPWYESRPYRNSRASIARAWYAEVWFTKKASCRSNASNALHDGSLSFLSSFALISSGKILKPSQPQVLRFVSVVSGWPSNELATIGVVAQIQPVAAVPVGLSCG